MTSRIPFQLEAYEMQDSLDGSWGLLSFQLKTIPKILPSRLSQQENYVVTSFWSSAMNLLSLLILSPISSLSELLEHKPNHTT